MTNKMQQMAEALRLEKEAKEAAKNGTGRKSTGDNASFPFWNIDIGKSATVRFLPDGDETNPWFWKERQVIKLPFYGIVGGEYPTDDNVEVTVPCMDMFEKKTCPIIAATRSWWGDNASAEKKALARQYYKKVSWLFQGFLVNSPLVEENLPENPIRRFVINKSIYEIIYASMLAGEMEDLPVDYVGGRDFKIAKTQKSGPDGTFANYGTSNWSMKVRPLDENENIAIEQYGLFNLSQFAQGTKPDADGVAMIKAMFEDSLAGKPFDYTSYGEKYKAYKPGREGDSSAQQATRTVVQNRSVADESNTDETAEISAPTSTGKKSAQDTLAELKAKLKAKA